LEQSFDGAARPPIRVALTGAGWATVGATRARGYAELDGSFLTAAALAGVLDRCATDAAWHDALRKVNGCFAVVTERAERVLAAVDRVRSIPLFYGASAGGWLLGDDARRLPAAVPVREPDALVEAEFCLTGYVTGAETLRPGVHQIEAGECVVLDARKPGLAERRRHYQFRHADLLDAAAPELIARLEEVHARVFRRLVAGTDGRTLVLPLSGGYDSRLIAVALRDAGVRDVVCFTYGAAEAWEARISREVARHLGFRWEFVPYSAASWRSWARTERFQAYFRAAGNLASVPHVQDWPAVLELTESRRVPVDSVFVPGHSGDFLAGSHIPKWYAGRSIIRRREVLDSLLDAHYSLWDWPAGRERELREQFDRRIETVIGAVPDCAPERAAELFERWDLQERQAKFICNAVRVYESFGYDWRLPLFDHELMDFWTRIPIGLRTGRRLYLEFARRRQALPVTEANRDRAAPLSRVIEGIEALGLRPVAKRAQRFLRRIRWRREYATSPLAWFALVDESHFGATYSGKELIHSYLARRYRDLVLGTGDELAAAESHAPRR
jgi:asparagine synthase (glutamine-hydrolysing)